MNQRHPLRRSDQHAATMARMRRMRNVTTLIAVMIMLTIGAGSGWLLMHPEQIGTFIGRVAAGVRSVAGTRP